MRLPKFEYAEPRSLEEASSLLSEHSEAAILAGGTDLLVLMKQRVATPQYVVNVRRLPGLDYIIKAENGLRIGALTTLSSVAGSAEVQNAFPMLSVAAGRVASRQIQTSATIGGNVCLDSKCWYYNQSHAWRKSREVCLKRGGDECHVVKGGKRCFAVLSGDTIPALIALGADVAIANSAGQRVVPIEEFYTGVGESPNVLKKGEIVTEIQIPYLPANARGVFAKHSIRGAIDFALTDVAAVVAMEDGICSGARLVVTAVGPAAIRATSAEAILRGKVINDAVLEEAGEAVVKNMRHVSGAYCSVYYRRKVVNALAKRAIRQAAEAN